MKTYTQDEILVALANLSDMLVEDSIDSKVILRFQELLKSGLTVEEAQDKIVWERTI